MTEEVVAMESKLAEALARGLKIEYDAAKHDDAWAEGMLRELVERADTPRRRKLPVERIAVVKKIKVGPARVYATAGLYPEGEVGELFLTVDKEGSTISGLLDAVATLTSIALQHGVPLAKICEKMRHTRFEPDGPTGDPAQPLASSVLDAVFGWLERRFVREADHAKEPVDQTRS